jgi:c-di-GMP-binding flagellar brake protein YcgR
MSSSNEENLESYTITFRREVVFYLRQLINDGERISVVFDEGRETVLTVLLDVDEEKNAIVFDWGGSESTNRRLLEANRIFFIAKPQGVRNQFITTRVRETTYKNRPAFITDIPDTYVRLQRREFFRMLLPMTQRRPCTFKMPGAEKVWEMSVIDLGLGGAGLESPMESLPFEVGQILPQVRIDLGKFGRIEVDLEIRYAGSASRGNKQVSRLGCHFVKLGRAQENELQRFITHVQREERAKLG